MSTLIINFNLTSSRSVTVQPGGSGEITFHVSWKPPAGTEVVVPEEGTFSASLPTGVTASFAPAHISTGRVAGSTSGTATIRAAANAPATGPVLAALYLNRAGLPPPIGNDFDLTVRGAAGGPPPKHEVKVPDVLGATQITGTAIASSVGLTLSVSFEFTAVAADVGIIFEQSPTAGASALAGSPITAKIGRKEPGG